MKALVTGGAGFIGSHLVHRLMKDGWEVVAVDNLSSGNRANLPPKATFKWMDLTSEEAVASLPKGGFDAVFHLASHVGQELSFERPLYDLKTNALSTLALLNWSIQAKVKKFIFASTMNVYGNPEELPVTEQTPAQPPSPYSVGKLASEHLCNIYQGFGLHTTCLRLFNVYGPMQDMKNLKQGMVSIYMSYIAQNAPIVVRGSKDRFRDFIFVDDVVSAFISSLQDKASGKIYNVSTGIKTHVWELLDGIVNAFGQKSGQYPIRYEDGTLRDQFGVYGDSTRLCSDLDWVPKTKLNDGLKIMADWVKTLSPNDLPEVK